MDRPTWIHQVLCSLINKAGKTGQVYGLNPFRHFQGWHSRLDLTSLTCENHIDFTPDMPHTLNKIYPGCRQQGEPFVPNDLAAGFPLENMLLRNPVVSKSCSPLKEIGLAGLSFALNDCFNMTPTNKPLCLAWFTSEMHHYRHQPCTVMESVADNNPISDWDRLILPHLNFMENQCRGGRIRPELKNERFFT